MISVLTLARKRSRFLAHYIMNFLTMTKDFQNVELLVMAAANDDWNQYLFKYFENHPTIKFFFENSKMGTYGRHIFFNDLAKHARGDWILHTCDDQIFILQDWDRYAQQFLKNINAQQIHIAIPGFDNTGSVDHFLSRGYLNTLGHLGCYPNIDSWINTVADVLPSNRIHHVPYKMMHDHTVDTDIETPAYLLVDNSVGVQSAIDWNSAENKNRILQDQTKLQEAMKHGL